MTGKRFIVDDDGIVTDMLDLSMYVDEEDCCEKLNELHEKNKQLLKSNKELKFEIKNLRAVLMDIYDIAKKNGVIT